MLVQRDCFYIAKRVRQEGYNSGLLLSSKNPVMSWGASPIAVTTCFQRRQNVNIYQHFYDVSHAPDMF